MITDGVVTSACGICAYGCGVLVHLRQGKVVKVEGNPASPVNKGVLCAKGLASLDYLYHSQRLQHPLQRVGERGNNQWREISWEEALSAIADNLLKTRDSYGAESVAFIMGGVKGIQDSVLARLAYTFGTPNFVSQGHVCYMPLALGSQVTCGYLPIPDYDFPPNCIMVWGANYADTRIAEHHQIIQALKRGSKLIVIDPVKTALAEKADLWLRVRPGADLALALAMINVIITEGLFDRNFVAQWTTGFTELSEHLKNYPPEKVATITRIQAETIRQAARLYATSRPAVIPGGNGLEHNVNSFQMGRAITILRAITGNLDVPGGDIQPSSLGIPFWSSPSLTLLDKLSCEQWEKRVDAGLKLLPQFNRQTSQSVIKAMREGKPYFIRSAYLQGCNALLSYAGAEETYNALQQLDFMAISDLFMTPTAQLADIVLPAASYLEFDSLVVPSYYANATVQVRQQVARIGECRSDIEIINELAQKLGLSQYFWADSGAFLDEFLRPAGLTFEEFRKLGILQGGIRYRKYERNGCETPSGKLELYSAQLQRWGFDPLPVYYELPETPLSTPELAEEYPLTFTTFKRQVFLHSGGRQIPALRRRHPEPTVSLHPETAAKLGIAEGDRVYIENKRGRIKQKATLTDSIDPQVVIPDYGWWYPETGDWSESNINILTSNTPPSSREVGSTNLRGVLCKVYKVV